jgi:hypothetical protein
MLPSVAHPEAVGHRCPAVVRVAPVTRASWLASVVTICRTCFLTSLEVICFHHTVPRTAQRGSHFFWRFPGMSQHRDHQRVGHKVLNARFTLMGAHNAAPSPD